MVVVGKEVENGDLGCRFGVMRVFELGRDGGGGCRNGKYVWSKVLYIDKVVLCRGG